MSALQIKTSVGVTCKACDQSLDGSDPELCGTCLTAVADVNRFLYKEDDDFMEELTITGDDLDGDW